MRSNETLDLWQRALCAAAAEIPSGNEQARLAARRLAHSIAQATLGDSVLELVRTAALTVESTPDPDLSKSLANLCELIAIEAKRGHERTSVLIVDDDPAIRRILERALTSTGRRVVQADSAADAEALLERERFALILLDLVLPDADGRNVLMKIRASPRTAGIPVFVLSAQTGVLPRTECLALGADGFFLKPFDPHSLTLELNAALQQVEERRRESARDALTGLPNRVALAELFAALRAQSARSHEPLSLAVIDLDDLKSINDKLGHTAGDRAIGHFSRIVRQTLRDSDVLARWGGDEFIALLPKTTAQGAGDVLQRCRSALQAHPFQPEGHPQRILTFSAGAADVATSQLEESIAEADRRVYIAKATGRDRVVATDIPADAIRQTILLAEDDAVTAAIVRHRLSQSHMDIVHATDGLAAWDLLHQKPVALAILDVQMPGIDGFELLNRIRKDPRYARLPVIMLTSLGNESDVIRAFDAGASDYVPKPFSPTELLKRIHRLLKR